MSERYVWLEYPEIIEGNNYYYKTPIWKTYKIDFDVDWYIQMSTGDPYGYNHLYMNTKTRNFYLSINGKRVRIIPRSDQIHIRNLNYYQYLSAVFRYTEDRRLQNLRYLFAYDSQYFVDATHTIETGYVTQYRGAAFNLNSDYGSLESVPDVVRGQVYTSHICITCNYGINFNNTNVFEKITEELYMFKNANYYTYSSNGNNYNIEHQGDLRTNNLKYLQYKANPATDWGSVKSTTTCNKSDVPLPFTSKINVAVTGNWKSFSYNTTDPNIALIVSESFRPKSYLEYDISDYSNQITYINTQTYRNKALNWDYANDYYGIKADKVTLETFESCVGVVQSEPVKVNDRQYYVDYTFTVSKAYNYCKCDIELLNNKYTIDLSTVHSETKRIYLSNTRYIKVYINYYMYFSAPSYILLTSKNYTLSWNTTLLLFSPLINNYEHDAITINKDYAIVGNVTNPSSGLVNVDTINVFTYSGYGTLTNQSTSEKIFLTQTNFLVRTNNSCDILEAFFLTQLSDSAAYDYVTIGDNYSIVINNHTYNMQLIHTAVATNDKESFLFKLLNVPELLDDFIDYTVTVSFNTSTKKLTFTVEPYID